MAAARAAARGQLERGGAHRPGRRVQSRRRTCRSSSGRCIQRLTPWGSVRLRRARRSFAREQLQLRRRATSATICAAKCASGRERGIGIGAQMLQRRRAGRSVAADRSRDGARGVPRAPRLPRLLPAPRRQLAFVTLYGARDLSLTGSYGDERWSSRDAAESVHAVQRRSRLAAESRRSTKGCFTSATLTLKFDTRTDPDDPWSGWYVERRRRARRAATSTATAPTSNPRDLRAGRHERVHARLLRLAALQPPRTRVRSSTCASCSAVARRRSAAARATSVGRRTGRAARLRFPLARAGLDVGNCNIGSAVLGRAGASAIASRSRRSSIAATCASTSRADWQDWPRRYHSAHGDIAWVLFADAGRGWLSAPRRRAC